MGNSIKFSHRNDHQRVGMFLSLSRPRRPQPCRVDKQVGADVIFTAVVISNYMQTASIGARCLQWELSYARAYAPNVVIHSWADVISSFWEYQRRPQHFGYWRWIFDTGLSAPPVTICYWKVGLCATFPREAQHEPLKINVSRE